MDVAGLFTGGATTIAATAAKTTLKAGVKTAAKGAAKSAAKGLRRTQGLTTTASCASLVCGYENTALPDYQAKH